VLTVGATGNPAPGFQWLKEGSPLTGETNAALSFAAAQTTNAGQYSVQVSNSAGTNTSDTATLAVVEPPRVSISSPSPDAIRIGFVAEPFVSYVVEYGSNAPSGGWTALATIPPQPAAGVQSVPDSTTNGPVRVYRVKLGSP
jgi:hypothetical protein